MKTDLEENNKLDVINIRNKKITNKDVTINLTSYKLEMQTNKNISDEIERLQKGWSKLKGKRLS